jgi:hypothetical protein
MVRSGNKRLPCGTVQEPELDDAARRPGGTSSPAKRILPRVAPITPEIVRSRVVLAVAIGAEQADVVTAGRDRDAMQDADSGHSRSPAPRFEEIAHADHASGRRDSADHGGIADTPHPGGRAPGGCLRSAPSAAAKSASSTVHDMLDDQRSWHRCRDRRMSAIRPRSPAW